MFRNDPLRGRTYAALAYAAESGTICGVRAAGTGAVLLALVGLGAVVGPAQGAYRGHRGVIVFERGSDLYTLRPSDGKVLRRLTKSEGLNTSPTWSPSGKRIAFASDRNTQENDVYVMNADGSGQTDIASLGRVDSHSPSWSPAGARIVFVRDLNDAAGEDLYVMNADGSGVHRIVTAPGFDNSPAWSPDGELIAYVHGTLLRTVRPDGSEMRTLAKNAGQPSWSASGRRIVYACGSHICSIGRAGAKRRQLTHGAALDSAPACSPDGRLVVFLSDRAFLARSVPPADLYVMHVDGTHLRRLTRDRVDDFAPDWQPLP
jgi:tricorn protease-like protein